MPEINDVWLDHVRQYQEERASIQKKAKCYYFASRALGVCTTVASSLLIGVFLCSGGYSVNAMCKDIFNINEKDIMSLNDTNSYLKQIVEFLGQDASIYTVESDIDTVDNVVTFTLSGLAVAMAKIPLIKLKDYFIRQHNTCISMLEASNNLQVPDYKDMKCYDQLVNVSKTNVGPISCVPVEEIEQKVFYRREVYEYYYLLTAYATNPKGRDHTGQLYDISLFYRIDDNNIQYID